MDVPAQPGESDPPEVPDFVPDDLAMSCGLCSEGGARWDPLAKRILCASCRHQAELWPFIRRQWPT
jgi:hypothetical protein